MNCITDLICSVPIARSAHSVSYLLQRLQSTERSFYPLSDRSVVGAIHNSFPGPQGSGLLKCIPYPREPRRDDFKPRRLGTCVTVAFGSLADEARNERSSTGGDRSKSLIPPGAVFPEDRYWVYPSLRSFAKTNKPSLRIRHLT